MKNWKYPKPLSTGKWINILRVFVGWNATLQVEMNWVSYVLKSQTPALTKKDPEDV